MATYEDFLAMGRNNLEDFRSVCGINKSGRKVELVAKAFEGVEGVEGAKASKSFFRANSNKFV